MKKRKAKRECPECRKRRERNEARAERRFKILTIVVIAAFIALIFFIGYFEGRASQLSKRSAIPSLEFRMEFDRKNDFVYQPTQPQFNCPVKEKF